MAMPRACTRARPLWRAGIRFRRLAGNRSMYPRALRPVMESEIYDFNRD